MSGIKLTVGSEDLMAARTGSGSRSDEIRRAGEGINTRDAQRAGGQSFDREAGKIDVSERAAQVGKLVDKVKDAPEIRQERVQELRRQIEAGNYNPPAAQIADAILKNDT